MEIYVLRRWSHNQNGNDNVVEVFSSFEKANKRYEEFLNFLINSTNIADIDRDYLDNDHQLYYFTQYEMMQDYLKNTESFEEKYPCADVFEREKENEYKYLCVYAYDDEYACISIDKVEIDKEKEPYA